MGQLPAENKQRSSPLVALLEVVHKFSRTSNACTFWVFSTPLFDVILKPTDTFETSTCRVRVAESQYSLQLSEVLYLGHIVTLSQPITECFVIYVFPSPSLGLVLDEFDPPPRMNVEMVYWT